MLTPCCSKGNQTWAGAHLIPKKTISTEQLQDLPKRSVSRVRNDTGQTMLHYQRCATCQDSLPMEVLNIKVIFMGIVQDLSQRPHFQSHLPWLLESHCAGQLPSTTVLGIHPKCLQFPSIKSLLQNKAYLHSQGNSYVRSYYRQNGNSNGRTGR